jgi:Mrp family chromosome partitioning ATPase
MADDRVDVRRYLDALRRSRRLIIVIVISATAVAAAISLSLPKTYVASTRIVLDEQASALTQPDATSTERKLATINQLLTTPAVLQAAAARVPGVSDIHVSSAVDGQANLITIDVADQDPVTAARTANAVAVAFLAERTRRERERIRSAIASLEAGIADLESAPNADVQIAAVRQRISELTVNEGSAGTDLQVAERATVPSEPSSPRPVRNSVLAFFAALFLAVLIALGRDQLVPRVAGPREIGRMLDVPVFGGIPYVSSRWRRRVMSGAEIEAYQTIRAALELVLPPDQQRMLLVTGAMHAEGKTTATARLGRVLAQGGRRVLLVSADLRVPRLHELFGLPLGVGVSDMLQALEWEDSVLFEELLVQSTNQVIAPGHGGRGELHVFTSGSKVKDPGTLITSQAVAAFFEQLRSLDYDYVLVDAPPLLGIADSQVLARHVSDMLLVHRLDRITLEHLGELRDVLDRLPSRAIGMIVIGVRGEVSPYYVARGGSLYEDTPAVQMERGGS